MHLELENTYSAIAAKQTNLPTMHFVIYQDLQYKCNSSS